MLTNKHTDTHLDFWLLSENIFYRVVGKEKVLQILKEIIPAHIKLKY